MATKKKQVTTLAEHLVKRYGNRGTGKRIEFEIEADAFLIGKIMKEERWIAKMTQQQLAEKNREKKLRLRD